MPEDASDAVVARAQKIRMRRLFWGSLAHGSTLVIALGYYVAGIVPGARVIHFAAAVILINLLFIGVIALNINLRFRDPSLSFAQVFAALWPSVYVMYYTTDPQARMAFLLMATVAILFGTLSLDFRHMLILCGFAMLSYLMMLAVLVAWAPERIHLKVEAVIVFAYAVVLVLVSYLGSFIAGLRGSLRERNQSLEAAMLELKELVGRDPLTRLPNRRSAMEQLKKEQARMERRQPDVNRLCLCLLDIDLFKRVNDTYGHQAGDAVLRRVGEVLQKSLRQGDFVGRFGGEEFLLILPESTSAGALALSERVRIDVAALQVPELEEGERITVSLGLAVHHRGDDIEFTIREADRALYRAKSQGRNQVVVAPASGDTRIEGCH